MSRYNGLVPNWYRAVIARSNTVKMIVRMTELRAASKSFDARSVTFDKELLRDIGNYHGLYVNGTIKDDHNMYMLYITAISYSSEIRLIQICVQGDDFFSEVWAQGTNLFDVLSGLVHDAIETDPEYITAPETYIDKN